MATKGRPREGAPTRYTDGSAVTPDDAVDLADGPCVGLSCAGAGVASVDFVDGSTAIIVGLLVGANPYAVTRVRSTGTTATGIVALY
jgi:hypothetical protein